MIQDLKPVRDTVERPMRPLATRAMSSVEPARLATRLAACEHPISPRTYADHGSTSDMPRVATAIDEEA